MSTKESLKKWIDLYKQLIQGQLSGKIHNEIYKWETIQHFQDNWTEEPNADNIQKLLNESFNYENNNLWSGSHYLPLAMLKEMANGEPGTISQMFKDLFNESESIQNRFDGFISKSTELLERLRPGEKLSHYQSPRSLSVYITLRYPDQYYFYKNGTFNDFCTITGIRPKPGMRKGNDYSIVTNYFEMCNEVNSILKEDDELIAIVKSILPSEINFKDDYHTLTQDFIWSVATNLKEDNISKFTLEEMKNQFKKYLEKVVPNSARNYMSAISTINKIAISVNTVDESIFEIQKSKDLKTIQLEIETSSEWAERNKVGHNMFKAALNKYDDFLVELEKGKIEFEEKAKRQKPTKNVILYGPPGTGKTFQTIDKAVEIAAPQEFDPGSHENNKEVFKRLLDKGNIVFTTFHQSYSYEDFVEGIKPVMPKIDSEEVVKDLGYKIENGVFKELCITAREQKVFEEDAGPKIKLDKKLFKEPYNIHKISLGDSRSEEDQGIYEFCKKNNCIALGFGEDIDFKGVKSKSDIRKRYEEAGISIEEGNDFNVAAIERLILWMNPGELVFVSNGNRKLRAIAQIDGDYYCDPKSTIAYHQFRKVKWLYTDLDIPVKEFYPRYFSQQSIYLMFRSEFDLEFFAGSSKTKKSSESEYVIIIDEINRGNVSQIFGELITLIEEDKREGAKEEIEITLPYSKTKFSVPPNLFIIGTMNTADRSVEALDTALRRRFSFEEIMPRPKLLEKIQLADSNISVSKLLEVLNERIEVLVDRDHQIGHSYFWNLTNLHSLKTAFHDRIIPLLKEYFFGDFYKLEMVIGEDFFVGDQNKRIVFANNSYQEADQYQGGIRRLKDVKSMLDQEFNEAIQHLIYPKD